MVILACSKATTRITLFKMVHIGAYFKIFFGAVSPGALHFFGFLLRSI